MRKLFTTFSIAILFFSAQDVFCQLKLNIVHPKPNSTIIASDTIFVYGNVSPPQAEVFINGIPAEVYHNGAFLVVIPVAVGFSSIHCMAILDADTARVVTEVYVPYYLKTSPEDVLTIDTSYVFPRENWTLRSGDIIKVAVKGTPDCKAQFSIKGIVENLPMTELEPRRRYYWGESIFGQGTNYQMAEVRGIYTGSCIIQPWDWGENLPITFTLQDSSGKIIRTTAPGELSINVSAIPQIVEFKENVIHRLSGTRIGTQLFLFRGVRARATMRRGKRIKILYTDEKTLWIKSSAIDSLPPGSTIPEGIVSDMRTAERDGWASLEINLEQRVPFSVSEYLKPTRLVVHFFNASLSPDSIRMDVNDPLIRNIHWENDSEENLKLVVNINQKRHWGYDPYYRNGKFYLDIKKKPRSGGWFRSPLRDVVICLDPGHSPDLGAISPFGVAEKDINFEYCKALKEKLEKKGARVFLTRGKADGISLQSRVQFAKFINADIFISIHFNGIPDGVNPFPIRGVATYYNQPHSYRLAYLIQNKMLDYTRAPNFGLYYANLFVCRTPQTIAVLAEPGFITHPVEETMIRSKNYRTRVVNAIEKALEQFLKETH